MPPLRAASGRGLTRCAVTFPAGPVAKPLSRYGAAVSSDPFLAFRHRPDAAAVITDFDGTLSPIVEDPDAARPLPGVVDTLHELARRYRVVAVVSGRPVDFLRLHLGVDGTEAGALVLSGLYGIERLASGRLLVDPAAEGFRPVVEEVAARAGAAAPAGVVVERKGLSVTLHVRTAPAQARWASSWAADAAAASGLVVHAGRMSFELRPPVVVDKGTVVAGLVEGTEAACFLGDDLGDLPAFSALDEHAVRSGAVTVRVGVRSDEAPAELVRRADVVVDGPAGALDVLRSLL